MSQWFENDFQVGDRVLARDQRSGWIPCVLTRAYADGRWDCVSEEGAALCGLTTDQMRQEPSYPSVGHDNLGLQFDLYHCQIMEGDLAQHLRDYSDIIRHIQIAGVPGRHEPTVGEINHPFLFALMDSLGYGGWVGCEYRPAGATVDGLGWIKEYVT